MDDENDSKSQDTGSNAAHAEGTKMSHVDDAVANLEAGYGCAQSVFAAFAPQIGLDRETALRIAGPFGGGIGGSGRTCGAVTGAVMAIGYLYGRTDPEDQARKEQNNQRVQALMAALKTRNGSTVCRELLRGYDISDPEDKERARQAGLFESACQKMVQDSAQVLGELLARWERV